MSIYTTPLQFGYFFSLIMAMVFWYRGRKEERLSDHLLGWVMLFLALELQDYTFGFAGINFLWDQMNGFPRGVALLFGPAVYFYFKSQCNRSFRFQKKHFLHLIPWAVYFLIQLVVFIQGKEAVAAFQSSRLLYYLDIVNYVTRLASYGYYFYSSLSIYWKYRKWSKDQFSDLEVISFKWFRNLLYFMILWIVSREVIGIFDGILDLNFYQDWWWNLPLAVTSFYVGIQGYAQRQPKVIAFVEGNVEDKKTIPKNQKKELAQRIEEIMMKDRLFLQPELSLSELSKHLKVNVRELSTAINSAFQLNFNDYINSKRIQAFEEKVQEGENKQFTLLSLAYDCGFNSKATFNRAFKKQKGISPKGFIEELEKSS